MIRLTTERLIIRDPQPTDIDGWHRLMSDPKTMYYLQDIMTHSLEESRQNLENAVAQSQSADRSQYFFAIEEKESGAFVGTAGYTVTDVCPVGKTAHIGYFILPEYHGQGIMTEALREIIRFALEEDGVYRLETGCITENRASERVMQKCGFIKEAERKAYVWHDGQLKDRVEYHLLLDEWEPQCKTFEIEPLSAGHRHFVDKQIAESWAGPYSVSRGRIHDTRTDHGFVAVEDGEVIGYALYLITDDECELAVLESLRENRGIGSALISAVIRAAKEKSCRRVWLITTNDNTHAIRFYQRFGFELKAVHINAMEEARKLKPQIPLVGNDGMPIKHEFEFEMAL